MDYEGYTFVKVFLHLYLAENLLIHYTIITLKRHTQGNCLKTKYLVLNIFAE